MQPEPLPQPVRRPLLDSDPGVECHPKHLSWSRHPIPQLSFHSPIGDLTVFEEDGSVVALEWGWASLQSPTPLLERVVACLDAYFDGAALPNNIPLSPCHGTRYQRRVWQVLLTIPAGQTRTYGELALLAGGSPRSVGTANASNPIPILIPCHRVIATGGIGGYSGGDGIPTKRFLLELESAFSRNGVGWRNRHPLLL